MLDAITTTMMVLSLPCVLHRNNLGLVRKEKPIESRSPQFSVEKTPFRSNNFLYIEMLPLAQFSHYMRYTAQ